jgi:uncharacterized damage-inducible protein DinB
MRNIRTGGLAAILVVLSATAVHAQAQASNADPLIQGMQDGNGYIRDMFTKAADQMTAEDYAFKPTPEVRSFGQLLAHVAASNYFFCSAAKSEKAPVTAIEKTATSRADIRAVLSASFDYCDSAYRVVTSKTDQRIDFMGKQRSPAAILNFRNYHALLHYGNVITYMRMKGKVPPSSQLTQAQ